MVPLVITETQVDHLRELLEQGDSWVVRARWVRWLDHGDRADTTPIDTMVHDDRVAACSWLRQQRHVLYYTVEHGRQAPAGWIEARPLYRGLDPDA